MSFSDFYHQRGNEISISGEQASRFAKAISNDFNPIHDPDNKRFCVPGDLLFALFVERFGVAKSSKFTFTGLVGADTNLIFPDQDSPTMSIVDPRGKDYLKVERSGLIEPLNPGLEALVRAYVRFSGQNFPHILVPLMNQQNVMINAQRPLIIYQSMALDLDTLDLTSPSLELVNSDLDIVGKRGDARLYFDVKEDSRSVGQGVKHLIISGLRPSDQEAVDAMVAQYLDWQSAYTAI